MKKIALCSLLSVFASWCAFALEVGTFTDANGLPYVRELGTLTSHDGTIKEVYREVYSDGRSVLKDMNGSFTSGKGAVFNPKPTPSPTPSPTSVSTAVPGQVNGAGVAMGALGVATGVVGMYDSVSIKDRKTTIGDVLEGAGSGALTAAGGALIVNSVPAFGQVAYGVVVAAGAVVGASGAGLKMFSETDCALDQVLTQARGFDVYQCCHTSQKLSTIEHANYLDIGARMFCPEPGMVSQCLQGTSTKDQGFKGLFQDDHWGSCQERWCSGWVKPASGERVQYYADYDNYCWKWECADGKKRQGNKCVGDVVEQCSYNGNKYDLGTIMENKDCQNVSAGNADLKTGKQCKVTCLKDKTSKALKAVWTIKTCPDGMKGVALSKASQYTPNATGYKKCIASDTNVCEKFNKQDTQDRYKCCLQEQEGVAKWENGICKCEDETQKWENGQCVDDTCRYTFTADIKCSNGTTKTMGSVLELRKSAFENGSCPDDTENVNFEEWYKNLRGEVLAEFNRICPQQSLPKPVVIHEDNGISNQKLNNAKGKLQEFFKFAEENRDGWKTADGKFNTKRLAADLSAGVVLGTVGGVVSGVVIKKKQVEKGFDALHCTVGGQTVADWGDEFSVGFQR
nr:hypothetical protein [Candidatus Enterousia merdequi]